MGVYLRFPNPTQRVDIEIKKMLSFFHSYLNPNTGPDINPRKAETDRNTMHFLWKIHFLPTPFIKLKFLVLNR